MSRASSPNGWPIPASSIHKPRPRPEQNYEFLGEFSPSKTKRHFQAEPMPSKVLVVFNGIQSAAPVLPEQHSATIFT